MKTRRSALRASALVVLLVSSGWAYQPFGRYNTAVSPNTLIPVRYDVSRLPNSTISFFLTTERPTAIAPGDSQEALISEIGAAADVWNSVPTSSLRVNFGGYTKLSGSPVPANPMGILSFSSDIPPGAAAVGGPLFRIPSGTPETLPIALSRVQLPADLSQTNTSSAGFLSVLVHEMGHSLGAAHSVVASVMFQTRLTSRARPLTEDDVALISTLHPAAGFGSSTGAVSGRVVTAAGLGASVAAVSAFSDSVVIGTFTNPDGSFTIRGLPPGTYRLMAQPLMLGAVPNPDADNPGDPADLISLRTLTNQVVSINTDVDSAFFAGGGAATRDPASAATFPVNAGQTTPGANLTIGSRGPLRLETNSAFSFTSNGRGVALVWITPGGRVTGGAGGRELTAPGLNVGFTSSELSLVPGSVRAGSNTSTIFNTSLNYDLQASSGATLGSSSVIYTNGDDTYFSAGQVRVVASGPPQISAVSPTGGAPRAAVTLTGSNFSDSSRVYFDGVPAQITSRSATSLVVVAPLGASGRAANVFVASADGQGSEFLAAPPIFTYSGAPAPSIRISPSSAGAGQTVSVRVTGTNTNFRQGETVVGFGSGDVVVNSVTVEATDALVARVRILSPVSSRTFPVTVITGEEIAFLDDGFTLTLQQPFTLVPASGAFQTGAPGSTLSRPLIVLSQDANGVPISGVSVSFSVAMGGGSVSPIAAVTDLQGLAQTQLTLGPAAGPNIVVASANQFASTSFVETAGAPFGLAYLRSGDQQTGTAGTELPTPLTVTVVASGGGPPLVGIAVSWVVTTGAGSVRPLAAVTDSNGQVSAVWTLGPGAGTQTVRAIPYFYNGVSLFGFNGTTFTATAQGGSLVPSVPATGILNAAGFDRSAAGVSPGAIVSIFGSNLSNAPATGVEPGLVPGTNMLTVLSHGTQVTFDGVPAPLFFVKSGQLNVQVPFEVAGRSSTQVIVRLAGAPSSPVTVTVLPTTPGLFTMNSSGRGPAVVLNEDGSFNSASNGVPSGRVIQLFATGLGAVSPPVATGRQAPVSPPLALSTELPVVTVDGIPATVEFSGLSPGFVGLWQVNVRVPAGTRAGEVTLLLRASGRDANPVTVFIR